MTTFQAQLILKRTFGRQEHACCRSCTRAGRDWTAQAAHHRRRREFEDRFGSPLLLLAILAVGAVGGAAVWGWLT